MTAVLTPFRLAALALTAALFIASCGLPGARSASPDQLGNPSAAHGNAVMRLKLPNLDAAHYAVQSSVPTYTKASINHLLIKAFVLSSGGEAPCLDSSGNPVFVDLASSSLQNAVVFGNMSYDTPYRIHCYAYKAAGTNSSDLISTSDSNSYTDLTLDYTNPDTTTTLKVRLIDVSNAGASATGGVLVTDGGIAYPPGTSATHSWYVSTWAGNGNYGLANTATTDATFRFPAALCRASNGSLYVADTNNHGIRLISGGIVTTYSGSTAAIAGATEGSVANARFFWPNDLAFNSAGVLFVADSGNNKIRRIGTDGLVSTYAGSTLNGLADGASSSARFYDPRGLALGSEGTVYVADSGNSLIRAIAPVSQSVITVAGTASGYVDGTLATCRMNHPQGLAVDASGSIYIADTGNHCIRKIANGKMTTFAGNGTAGFADGSGTSARFNRPMKIAFDSNWVLYVSDFGNNRIRKVSPTGYVSTYAGNGVGVNADGFASKASIFGPSGLAPDPSGNLYVAASSSNQIRFISLH